MERMEITDDRTWRLECKCNQVDMKEDDIKPETVAEMTQTGPATENTHAFSQ